MIDVSIIIPSWNAKNMLQECLKSIFAEPIQFPQEVIVVDNASTDGSSEMVIDQFPQIKLIQNKTNLGFAKACNIGIMQATDQYIVLLNSDIIIGKECISRMINYMEQHLDVGILGPKILDPNGTVQRSCMGFPTLWNTFCRALALDTIFPKSKLFGGLLMTFWPHDTLRSVDVINGCFWLVRQTAIKQVGLLDEDFFIYSEDKDWCKRFRKAGLAVTFFPEAEAIHYGGVSSSNTPIRFYVEMQRANLLYWRKHHNRTTQLIFLFIALLHHFIRILGQIINLVVHPSKRPHTTPKILRSFTSIRWLLGNCGYQWNIRNKSIKDH